MKESERRFRVHKEAPGFRPAPRVASYDEASSIHPALVHGLPRGGIQQDPADDPGHSPRAQRAVRLQ